MAQNRVLNLQVYNFFPTWGEIVFFCVSLQCIVGGGDCVHGAVQQYIGLFHRWGSAPRKGAAKRESRAIRELSRNCDLTFRQQTHAIGLRGPRRRLLQSTSQETCPMPTGISFRVKGFTGNRLPLRGRSPFPSFRFSRRRPCRPTTPTCQDR